MNRGTLLVLSFLLSSTSILVMASDELIIKNSPKKEFFDRQVDQAALSSQKQAEKRLLNLLRKYRGSKREALLLARLSEIYQQRGSIEFRIAHGKNHSEKSKLNLRKYRTILRKTIKTLNQLLAKFPNYPGNDKSYFMRAKSHEELGSSTLAIKDYLYLVKNYPTAPEVTLAYMSLAQFAIDNNQHEVAVKYLHQVEKHPENSQYPYAIYKLAWSYYNLSQIDKALNYIENHIIFYNAKFEIQKGYSSADLSIRDTSLLDTAVFYFHGFDQSEGSDYPIKNALNYFKSLETGAVLGKMMTRFAKLLRSNAKTNALKEWQDLVVENEPRRPETMSVVLTTFEHLWNQKHFKELGHPSKQLVRLYEINKDKIYQFKPYKKAQSLLLGKAKELRKIILKNKQYGSIAAFSQPLADIYDTFTKIVKESDPRVPAVHYNLAETLYAIKKYDDSTKHYRWIVDRWNRNWQVKKGVQLENSSLKAIASRYEVLRNKKLVPKDVAPKSFSDNEDSTAKPIIQEWVKWIDWHEKRYTKNYKKFDNYLFEANRILYQQEKISLAHKRLIRFSERYPNSKFAIPSASLALDTYLKDKNWKNSRDLAQRFMRIKAWKKTKFISKLFTIAADSSYKLIESGFKNKEIDSVLSQSAQFIKKYSKSPRLQDVLFIAGKAAVENKDDLLAQRHFKMLIAKFPKSDNVGPAILNHAKIYESQYQFVGAASDYEKYLNLPKKLISMNDSEKRALKKKILKLHWIASNQLHLRILLENSKYCKASLADLCDQYQALISLNYPVLSPKKLIKRSINAPRNNRPIWAVAALQNQEEFKFPDRMLLARIIAGRYNRIDPEIQMNLLPYLSKSIPKAFELNRARINKYAALRPSESSISHRVKLIKEMENTSKSVMKMPWTRIRASVMNEISELYLDFSKALTNLPAPKGLPVTEIASYKDSILKLILPFEEKGQELRSKAFEIASKNSIERRDFLKIQKLFFRDNPSQADKIVGKFKKIIPLKFHYRTLRRLDGTSDWKKIPSKKYRFKKNPSEFIRSQWAMAISKKNWAKVSYFMHEAKEITTEESYSLMKVVTLVYAGAKAEALKELADIKSKLGEVFEPQATIILLSHYLSTHAKERVKDLVEDLESESPGNLILQATSNQKEAFLVSYAKSWTNANISDRNTLDLLLLAKKSPSLDESKWSKNEIKAIRKSSDPKKNRKIAAKTRKK